MIKAKTNLGFTLQYKLMWSDGTVVDLRKKMGLRFILVLPNDTTINITSCAYDAVKNVVWVRIPAEHTSTEGVYRGTLSVMTSDLQMVTTGICDIAELANDVDVTYKTVCLTLQPTVVDTPVNIGQGYSPKIIDSEWYVYDDAQKSYVATGYTIGVTQQQFAEEMAKFEEDFAEQLPKWQAQVDETLSGITDIQEKVGCTKTIDKTLYPTIKFNLENTKVWKADNSYLGRLIPVDAFYGNVTFVNKYRVCVAFLKDDNIVAGETPHYCDGTTKINNDNVGDVLVYNPIPSDCQYIYVYISKNGDSWNEITTSKESSFIEKTDIINSLTTGGEKKVLSAECGKQLNNSLIELNTEITGAEKHLSMAEAQKTYTRNFNCTNKSTKWASDKTYKCVVIPREKIGKYLHIVINSGYYLEMAQLVNDNIVAGEPITNNTTGATKVPSQNGPKEYEVELSDDCNFLYIYTSSWTNCDSRWSISYSNRDSLEERVTMLENRPARTIAESYADNPDVGSGKLLKNKFLRLMFFSDLHKTRASFDRTKEIVNLWKDYKDANGNPVMVNDVLFGGDLVGGNFSEVTDFWENDEEAQKWLFTVGNHEGFDETRTTFVHRGKDCYDRFIAPNIAKWGETIATTSVNASGELVINGDNQNPTIGYVPDHCYYYKDYATSKIRLIVADITDWYDVYDGHLAENLTPQHEWVKAVLYNAKNKRYQVAFLLHDKPSRGLKTYCKFDNITASTSSYYTYCVDAVGDLRYIVDDWQTNGGQFIAFFSGHTHYDEISFEWDSQLTDNPIKHKQLSVVIACANATYAYSQIGTLLRSCTTKNVEDLTVLDHITIDPELKMVYIQRIGANRTMYGDTMNSIAIDYRNCKIIRQS